MEEDMNDSTGEGDILLEFEFEFEFEVETELSSVESSRRGEITWPTTDPRPPR
jgi:hypothetical protein